VPHLKAIETIYNGYRFRSRLEARWAVFFDTLSIKYEYEKEGFDLGDAGWYLPDFWLPQYRYWVEIKGDEPTGKELARATALHDHEGVPVIVCHGLPGEYAPWCIVECAHDSGSGGTKEEYITGWFRCRVCGQLDISVRCHEGCDLYSFQDNAPGLCCCHSNLPWPEVNAWWESRFDWHDTHLESAYAVARQARFEHGATPST
jgi:hypothetical protein